ncbi:MAG: hypothetical protein KBD78_08380 [Oligoflexales bacterium]|nr:hypothetical protein [Oligoflexales bacterium]
MKYYLNLVIIGFFLPPANLSAEQSNKTLNWSISLASGLGQFSDLQVPYSEESLFFGLEEANRADGIIVSKTSQNHQSIPIDLRFQRVFHSNSEHQFSGELHLLHMVSSRGEADASSASYFHSGLNGRYHNNSWQKYYASPRPLLDMGIQRSRYLNVSSGHFIDTVIPRLGLSLESKNEQYYGHFLIGRSLYSQLKYYPGRIGSATALKDTEALTSQLEINGAYKLMDATFLEFTYQSESSTISYKSTNGYERFGLVATDSFFENKITLTNNAYHLGIKKLF